MPSMTCAHRKEILPCRVETAQRVERANAGIGQLATDAATFIDALGLKTADLLGHSMGGLVAQRVAIQRPDLGPAWGFCVGDMSPT
jgi:pimeloyl-ACP methyl ester carboxylesterase